MRTIFVIPALLCLAWPSPEFGERPRPNYTTLVIEFVGEMDRPVFPIVISTSAEEAEWYKQQLFQGSIGVLADVDVVPASSLNEITEVPLLKSGLQNARPAEEEPKTTPTVRFVAGDGHDYVQVMFDAETSMKILQGIAKRVGKYSILESRIQEIEDRVKSAMREHR